MAQMFADLLQVILSLVFIAIVACFIIRRTYVKIKKFWKTTENVVRLQISVVIITYCLVTIVQHNMQLKNSDL